MKERERDTDELVNLVHMKCDIMKTLEKRLALVKKMTAELQSKVEQLCSEHTEPPHRSRKNWSTKTFSIQSAPTALPVSMNAQVL